MRAAGVGEQHLKKCGSPQIGGETESGVFGPTPKKVYSKLQSPANESDSDISRKPPFLIRFAEKTVSIEHTGNYDSRNLVSKSIMAISMLDMSFEKALQNCRKGSWPSPPPNSTRPRG
jgi:hypothetical protein